MKRSTVTTTTTTSQKSKKKNSNSKKKFEGYKNTKNRIQQTRNKMVKSYLREDTDRLWIQIELSNRPYIRSSGC
jgi:hypothetical protein